MSYLDRIKTRIGEEGGLRTLKYGALVGADSVKTYLRDTYLDLKYSGRVLHGNKASEYKAWGANDVYHTDYCAMPLIFRHVEITPADVLVDVGCGKGRVINYWLSREWPNNIIGLELDSEVAAATARQFARHPNVKIVAGDAIANLPPDGTVYYFYNPFKAEKVVAFEHALREKAGNKRVTVVYYNPQSLHIFKDAGWSVVEVNFERDLGIRRWGRLNKFHDLAIIAKAPAHSKS